MKIPKKDGTTKPDDDSVDNWEDILCDKCRKSCRDDEGMNHEYADVSAHWGYGSRKDGETHKGQVCELCYDALGIRPSIKDYFGYNLTCSCNKGDSPVPGPCPLHKLSQE